MNVYIDPRLMKESGAVIYTPSQKRKRFPENCVRLVASEDEARSGAKPDEHFHAAVVIGRADSLLAKPAVCGKRAIVPPPAPLSASLLAVSAGHSKSSEGFRMYYLVKWLV